MNVDPPSGDHKDPANAGRDDVFELIEYTITPKGKDLCSKIDNFWEAVNALPGFNADIYLEDLSRDKDLLEMELVNALARKASPEAFSWILQNEIGGWDDGEYLAALVKRGLLDKKVRLIPDSDPFGGVFEDKNDLKHTASSSLLDQLEDTLPE